MYVRRGFRIRVRPLRRAARHRHGTAAEPQEPHGPPPIETAELAKKFSVPELRERLGQFYTFFVNALEGTVGRAESGEQNVEKRERLTLIKIRAARACRNAVFQSSPVTGYIDTLALCVQMCALVNTPEVAELLGPDLPEFAALTEKLDREITALGGQLSRSRRHRGAAHQSRDLREGPSDRHLASRRPALGQLRRQSPRPRLADRSAARGLIDHAALRAAQLLAGVFAFALFWRLVVRRLAPRDAAR